MRRQASRAVMLLATRRSHWFISAAGLCFEMIQGSALPLNTANDHQMAETYELGFAFVSPSWSSKIISRVNSPPPEQTAESQLLLSALVKSGGLAAMLVSVKIIYDKWPNKVSVSRIIIILRCSNPNVSTWSRNSLANPQGWGRVWRQEWEGLHSRLRLQIN